jgi:alpha,alpha-trehalase
MFLLLVSFFILKTHFKTMKISVHSKVFANFTEDTDQDKKITKDDHGPKRFVLVDEKKAETVIEGTYHLANLLQEPC